MHSSFKSKLTGLKKTYQHMSVPLKAGIWFSICGFLQKGISFITMPIFTRILPTYDYGVVTVYNSWISIFSIFITLNVFYGVFNTAMIEFEDERDKYASSLIGFIFVNSILFAGLYLLFRNTVDKLTGLDTNLTILLFLQVFFQGAASIWLSRNKFSYQYIPVAIATLILFVSSPVLSILLIKVLPNKAYGKILGNVVAYILVGMYSIFDLHRKGKVFYSKKFWKYVIIYGGSLIVHYLASTVLGQSDRIMIDKIVSTSTAAVYSVAYSVSSIFTIVTTSVNQAIVPWLYRCLREKDLRETKRTIISILLGVFISLFSVTLIGPELIAFLAPSDYIEAKWVIGPLTASLFFTFIYQLFANIEFFYKKNEYIVISSVLSAVLNIVLNAIFIRAYGFIAAGYTTLVSYAAFGLFHFYCAKRICKMKDIEWPYDNKVIFLLSFLCLLMPLFVSVLYQNNIIRYIVLILIITAIIVFRKSILHFVQSIRGKGAHKEEGEGNT